MEQHIDLAIIGGGCAGLSLAGRLVNGAVPARTIVLESRDTYVDDRTWCFWASQGSGQEHLPLHSWEKVRVVADGNHAIVDFERSPYQMLRSIDFYRHQQRLLVKSSVTLSLGTSILSVQKGACGKWRLTTPSQTITADFVVDTRPQFQTSTESPLLWQTFVGFEIESERETFDSSVATLMDFQEVESQEIPFLYVLPLTAHRALVELTVISSDRASFESLTARLKAEVQPILGASSFRVVRKEQGAIPMGTGVRNLSADPSYVHVGVTAGSARASSGYTFCRIQKWADQCSKSLLAGGPPIGPLEGSSLVSFMDVVFLKVLRRHPQLGPELFLRMFQRVPSKRLLRFLSDSPSLLDTLCLIAALPKAPFLRECFHLLRKEPLASGEVPCSL